MSAIVLEMRLTAPLPLLLQSWWLALILCLAGLISRPALAQDGGPTGKIIVIVFDINGLPVEGVRVRQGNATVATTDSEGVATIETRPGQVTLSFQKDGFPSQNTPLIPVVAGRSLEILVTYTRSPIESVVDVEAPSGEGLTTTTATATGRVEGTLVDDKGRPLANAQVFVRGLPIQARSDAEGRFTLPDVPATELDLTIIHPDFTPTNKKVEVSADETAIVAVEVLAPVGFSQEFIVTIPKLEGGAVFVLEERRESSSVADLLGADQIAKSGDSDAASALQRVTGITLVGGRYVYVRGLGERYSTTLLDGSTLPSPDPERRVVPLDLFPASILGSIVVQKTYSPDLPGEFGGGVVNLRTREVPDDFEFKVSVSAGYRDGTTFDSALGYEGTSTDFLGFGVDGRSPTPEFQAALDAGEIAGQTIIDPDAGFTVEELQAFAVGQNNDFGLRSQDVPPDFGANLSLGGSFDLGGRKAGVLVGVTYGNTWFAQENDFNQYSTNTAENGLQRLDRTLGVRLLDLINNVNLGGIGVASFEINENNKVLLTTSLNRISEYSGRLQYGDTRENITRLNRLRWVEQQLITAQLRGEHDKLFGSDLRADWRYMFSTATRDEPDRREVTYVVETQRQSETLLAGSFRLDNQDILNQRFLSSLEDFNHDIGLDLTLPLKIFGDVETKLKVGGAAILKNRTSRARRFGYAIRNFEDVDTSLPPGELFNEDSVTSPPGENAGFVLQEVTQEDDSSEADQQLYAGYIMGDVGFLENLRLLIGARLEASEQTVQTFAPGADEPNDGGAGLNTVDVMPAATLTWEFVEDMQLRIAGSRTVSRPNFRELSPSVFRDLGGTVEFQGNEDLERTLITSADLRYEWYPSPGESFSVSAFYKLFENPVEQTTESGATSRFIPANVPEAFNVGGEIETRLEFGWLADALADLYFAGNLTLVFSEVRIPDDPEIRGTLTNLVRPLAQQSPWVINAQLGYDNPEIGLSTSVLYNIFGPRIWAVGQNGLPDTYEQPFDQLDFVISWSFDRFKIQAKARNILDPISRATQESPADDAERPVFAFRRGRRFTIGIGVNLN